MRKAVGTFISCSLVGGASDKFHHFRSKVCMLSLCFWRFYPSLNSRSVVVDLSRLAKPAAPTAARDLYLSPPRLHPLTTTPRAPSNLYKPQRWSSAYPTCPSFLQFQHATSKSSSPPQQVVKSSPNTTSSILYRRIFSRRYAGSMHRLEILCWRRPSIMRAPYQSGLLCMCRLRLRARNIR